jgi:AcrR family transcriptional regulator
MSSKSEILARIESLFFDRTFSDLSMEEIAVELGMKKASLYYHFESKEAMISEVLSASFAHFREAFVFAVENEPPDEMVRKIVTFSSNDRNLFSVILSKGACRLPRIREEARAFSESLMAEGSAALSRRFGFSIQRSMLFFSLLECLS